MFYQVWYVICHVLHIYANFFMLDANFNAYCIIICLWCAEIIAYYMYINFDTCCMIMLYVKICPCCTTNHLCYTKISIFVVLSFLIFVVSTKISVVVSTKIYVASTQQIYAVSRFVIGSTFSITPYSENLSSLAVACVTTTIHDQAQKLTMVIHNRESPRYIFSYR